MTSRYTGLVFIPALVLGLVAGSTASVQGQVKPVNLDGPNTKADEVDPFILADGQTMYYASNSAGNFNLMMTRRGSKSWSAGKAFPIINSKDADTRSPFYFAKENTFYYATNAVPDEKFKDLKNFDIKKKTGERASLPVPGISEKEDELRPWITSSGKEFYFSRKAKEGWTLFMAIGPNPGPIGNAKAVGFPPGFHHASLATNGLFMVLQGPVDNGRNGLFTSRRTKAGGPWSKPEPLTQLNSAEGSQGDLTPVLSPDGSRLYFVSDRPGGKGGLDLWGVTTKELKLDLK